MWLINTAFRLDRCGIYYTNRPPDPPCSDISPSRGDSEWEHRLLLDVVHILPLDACKISVSLAYVPGECVKILLSCHVPTS